MVGSANKTKEVSKLSELYIDVPTDGFSMLDFNKMEDLIKIGYDTANKSLESFDLNKTLKLKNK
jgi:hypothetical protein